MEHKDIQHLSELVKVDVIVTTRAVEPDSPHILSRFSGLKEQPPTYCITSSPVEFLQATSIRFDTPAERHR